MGFFNRLFGGNPAASEPSAYQQLADRAMEHLRTLTSAHDAMWHLSDASWSVDQVEGKIIFTTPQGVTATAPVQIVGTYSINDRSWLWGWDHPSIQGPLTLHAKQMLEYGRQHNMPALTTRKLECSEEQCWELVAIACMLCQAQGAYRGPAGPALVFMTFGDVQLTRA